MSEAVISNRSRGTQYERIAEKCLESQGYRILERNFSCRQGEIDIIAKESGYLVFVEVKYRKNGAQGDPAEAVDARKKRRICLAAARYLYLHKMPETTPCRFDVIALIPGQFRICKNAFDFCG